MKNFLLWLWCGVKFILLVVFLLIILVKLQEYYSLSVALGLISLAMTVLPGTTIVKSYIQTITIPSGKTYDIWMLASISVAFYAAIQSLLEKKELSGDDKAYLCLIGILILIMICSAILTKISRK